MTTVTLLTGQRIVVRPIRARDKALLCRLHASLSPESQYRRFLSTVPALSAGMQAYLTEVDHHDHEALFAFDAQSHDPVATARFIRQAPGSDTAEFAVTVADAWQYHGVGTALFAMLVERARQEGIHHFVGDVLTQNAAMHHLMRHLGHPTVCDRDAGVETLVVDLPA